MSEIIFLIHSLFQKDPKLFARFGSESGLET
jgi:hypothetical protein